MRKAFNFFNSYWQTANELSDKDRLAFYDAVTHLQFTGDSSKVNNLTGMAKFAYISQKHSIESQISGYIDNCKKLKISPFCGNTIPPALPPALGGSLGADEGAALPPALQVQGEVQVKGKVKGKGEVSANFIPTFEDFKKNSVEKEKNIDVVDYTNKYDD